MRGLTRQSEAYLPATERTGRRSSDGSGAPRIAVACSGLGHVQRGIEAWATDLARGLRQVGIEVTLFAGTTMDGAEALPCLHRTARINKLLSAMFRQLGGWRYGVGSPYEVEQTSFAVALWSRIRRGYDIVHVQDPTLAYWLQWASRHGLSSARVLYANGTGEGPAVMGHFRYLQFLTRGTHDVWLQNAQTKQRAFIVPNFVDTRQFSPGDQQEARAAFGLPRDATIILCCAAIRRPHKRIDYLLQEYRHATQQSDQPVMLVVAGGRETDTESIIVEGTALLTDQVRFLPDLPRRLMPELYRTADVFVLPSLHEMFGIVLLEAMASGLPVLCHDAPDFRAICGHSALYRDLSVAGGLASGLNVLLHPKARAERAALSRPHVVQHFSERVVIPDILAMYDTVMETRSHG